MYDEVASTVADKAAYEEMAGVPPPPPARAAVPRAVQVAPGGSAPAPEAAYEEPEAAYVEPEAAYAEPSAAANPEASAFASNPAFEAESFTGFAPTATYVCVHTACARTRLDLWTVCVVAQQNTRVGVRAVSVRLGFCGPITCASLSAHHSHALPHVCCVAPQVRRDRPGRRRRWQQRRNQRRPPRGATTRPSTSPRTRQQVAAR